MDDLLAVDVGAAGRDVRGDAQDEGEVSLAREITCTSAAFGLLSPEDAEQTAGVAILHDDVQLPVCDTTPRGLCGEGGSVRFEAMLLVCCAQNLVEFMQQKLPGLGLIDSCYLHIHQQASQIVLFRPMRKLTCASPMIRCMLYVYVETMLGWSSVELMAASRSAVLSFA